MQIEDVPTVYKVLLIDFEKMGFEDLNKYSQKSVEKAPPSLLAPYPGRKC